MNIVDRNSEEQEEMQDICLIKIWSNSIVDSKSGEVNMNFLKKLKIDIDEYEKSIWKKVMILSSGAVALWKIECKAKWIEFDKENDKAFLASVGQTRLINLYKSIFDDRIVDQVLFDDELNTNRFINKIPERYRKNLIVRKLIELISLIKEDSKSHLVKEVLAKSIKKGVLAVLNHNDTTSSYQLRNLSDATDNDSNVLYISKSINDYMEETKVRVSDIIFVTNERWVLDWSKKTIDWNKETVEWKVLELSGKTWQEKKDIIDRVLREYGKYIYEKNKGDWTWWMYSKVKNALECLLVDWVEKVSISASKDWLDFLRNQWLATTFIKK